MKNILFILGLFILVIGAFVFLRSDSENYIQLNEHVRIYEPLPDSIVTSPLTIRGEAKGWFFEGDFPVVLTDWDGLIIAERYATAQGEWMTEEYVPFEAVLEFETPEYGERGSLILQKANASGLPQHDDAAEIVVYFEKM